MWGLFGFFAFFCPHIKTNLGNYKLQSESYWFLISCSKVLKIDWLMGIIWKGTSGGYLPRELYFLYWERWYLSTQERKDSVWNLSDNLPPKPLYGGEETQSRQVHSDTWWTEICMLLWLANTMNFTFHLPSRMWGANQSTWPMRLREGLYFSYKDVLGKVSGGQKCWSERPCKGHGLSLSGSWHWKQGGSFLRGRVNC